MSAEPSASLAFLLSTGGSRVEVVCLGCKRCPSVDIIALAATYGETTTIAEIGRRARCSVCGHKGAKLNPIPDYTGGVKRGLGD